MAKKDKDDDVKAPETSKKYGSETPPPKFGEKEVMPKFQGGIDNKPPMKK